MTPNGAWTILNDWQGLWMLIQYYIAAPFTESRMDTGLLLEIWNFLQNHPLRFFAAALILLLLSTSLLASGAALACDFRSRKKEQEKRHLVRHKECCKQLSALSVAPLAEREIS